MKRFAVCLFFLFIGLTSLASAFFEAYVAHFVDGPGYVTTLTLFNSSTMGYANITATLYNDDGSLATLRVNGREINEPMAFVLPPGGSYFLKTDGTSPSLVSGWVHVVADQIVRTSVLFTSPAGDAGVLEAEYAAVSDTPVKVSDAEGRSTALAIVNPADTETSLSLDLLWPAGGTRLRSTTFNIPPHGRLIGFLPDLMPGMPNPWEGTVQINAADLVAATAIQTGPGTYATLPVMTLDVLPGQFYDFAAIGGTVSPMTVIPDPISGYRVWLDEESSITAAFQGNNLILSGQIVTGSLQFHQLDGTTAPAILPNASGQINVSHPSKSLPDGTYQVIAFERGIDRAGYADGCFFIQDFQLVDIQNFTDPEALSIIEELSYSPIYIVRNAPASLTLYLDLAAHPLVCGFDAASGTIQAGSTTFTDPDSGAAVTISLQNGALPDYQTQARATLTMGIQVTWVRDATTQSVEFTATANRY
jgi:hypothetical protein